MSHLTAHGFGWKHAGRKKPALAHIDLTIDHGERVLIAGSSGAGKSTFLHAVAGVLPTESGTRFGELLIDGAPPNPAQGTTGLVLQDPDSQAVLSRIGPDVAFGAENLRIPAGEIPGRVRWALDTVGLHLHPDWPTAKLSGGQKQRLALAGILAMRPSMILLDEPTANIDPQSAPGLRDAVLKATEATGATLLVVEHRLDLWADHVDRMIVLSPTGVIADGPPREIMKTHFTELQAAGLWVSSSRPTRPVRKTHGDALLDMDATVGRRATVTQAALSIHEGQALAIIGPNGAGKSTTALTAGGLLKPLSGHVTASERLRRFDPQLPVRHASPRKWRSKALSRRIGTVFQAPEHQFVTRTVRDELALGGMDHADDLLDRLRLTHLAAAHPTTLSGGEKRRLSVACMLATPVLIVDEPTFGQDALSWKELATLLSDAVDRGSALITVTHDPDFIAAIGADVYELGT